MRTDSTTTIRLRAVFLSMVMVLSVFAAATAVAAPAVAGDGPVDALDLLDTDTLETTSDDEDGSNESTADGGDEDDDDRDGSTDENDTDSSDGETESSDATASASPTVVGVTAGATNQPPVSADGETALTFTEDDSSAFPESGTVTLSISGDVPVDFDVDGSSVDVTTSEGMTVSDVELTAEELRIHVDETDPNSTDSLSIEGLVFDIPADSSTTELAWTFGDTEDTVTLEPERLETTVGGTDHIPRGAHGEPSDGLTVHIGADANEKHTAGLHDESEFIAVRVPESQQETLSFDMTSEDDVTIETFGPNCGDEFSLIDFDGIAPGGAAMSEDVFFFEVDCDVSPEDDIFVRGLRLNTTGVSLDDDDVEFDALLDVEYVPVDARSLVTITTEDAISVVAPAVSADGVDTTVAPNRTATSGDEPVRITVADAHGGQLESGTELEITLSNPDAVGFNESQTVEVEVDGDGVSASVEAVSADTITLSIDDSSVEGDELTVQGVNGTGLLFDSDEDASGDTAITVTTDPGGESVTQRTDGSVSVENDTDDGGDGDSGNGDDGSSQPGDGDDGDDSNESDDDERDDSGTDDGGSDDSAGSSPVGGGGGSSGSGDASSEDESSGAQTTQTTTQPIESDGENESTVRFDGVPIDAITFEGDVTGDATVSVLTALPDDVGQPDGTVVYAIAIDVPDDLRDHPATIQFSVDAETVDSMAVTESAFELARFDADAGEWRSLETTAIGDSDTTQFMAQTPGFSLFAVYASESGTTPTPEQPQTGTPTSTPTSDAALVDDSATTVAETVDEAGIDPVRGSIIAGAALGIVLVVFGIRLIRRN